MLNRRGNGLQGVGLGWLRAMERGRREEGPLKSFVLEAQNSTSSQFLGLAPDC